VTGPAARQRIFLAVSSPPLPAHPPSDPAPALSARALGAQRGERPLFRGLHLELAPGRLVWLRGRNGRGKTSLLRILAGLSTPAAGEVLLDGQPLQRQGPQWRSRSLYIAHANALKDDLTVAECLRFLGALHGSVPSAAAIDQALALLGITRCTHALVRTLSQGQRRRAALARLALPQPPSVWLLDEPFDALDVEGVDALHGLLSAHARRGGSALMTSHQPITLADPVPEAFDLDAFAVPT
jgi:heme exporter protein A